MKNSFVKMGRIAFVLSLALLVFFAGGCQTVSKLVNEPQISFNSVSIQGLSFTGADMLAKINVVNNNSFSIPFPRLEWELFISSASFIKGTVENSRKIAANSTTVVDLPFHVPYESLYKTLPALVNADEIPYRVDVGARFSLPVLGDKLLATSFSGAVPLLKLPALSFGGIKFNSLGLSGIDFVLTWAVENKNSFALKVDKLAYNFGVNGAEWASVGHTPADTVLLPRRTTQIPVRVRINALPLVKDIVNLAAAGKPVNYTCSGETSLSPQGGSNPAYEKIAALTLPFNYSGVVNLRP